MINADLWEALACDYLEEWAQLIPWQPTCMGSHFESSRKGHSINRIQAFLLNFQCSGLLISVLESLIKYSSQTGSSCMVRIRWSGNWKETSLRIFPQIRARLLDLAGLKDIDVNQLPCEMKSYYMNLIIRIDKTLQFYNTSSEYVQGWWYM